MKASPAAVVSTAWTLNAGIRAILATGIHKDRGDAAGNAGGDAHVSRVNALRFKIPNRCGPEKIAPYFCHHAHVRAAETRRNRLVGAFAAEAEIELPAEDGFPRPREHIMERGKVHVSAAHNGNKGRLGHHFASGDSRRGLYKNPAREPHLLSIAKRTVAAVGLEWGCCILHDALDIFPSGSTSCDSHHLRKLHDNQSSWS